MRSVSCAAALGLAALLVLLSGCDAARQAPTSPGSTADVPSDLGSDVWTLPFDASGGFDVRGGYPLQPGNRWVHELVWTSDIADFAAAPLRIFAPRYTIERTLDCVWDAGTATYVVERTVTRLTGSEYSYETYLPMREDGSGLYEYPFVLDSAPCGDPPPVEATAPSPARELRARLAGRLAGPNGAAWAAALARHEGKLATVRALAGPTRGPGASGDVNLPELRRLAYPLERGTRWMVRHDATFEAVVVGRVAIRGADRIYSGWEIRYSSLYYGARDVVTVWYGAAGYLGLHAIFDSPVLDENGQPIGSIQSEQRETIVSFEPARAKQGTASWRP